MDVYNVFRHLILIILGIVYVGDTVPKNAVDLHNCTYFSSTFGTAAPCTWVLVPDCL